MLAIAQALGELFDHAWPEAGLTRALKSLSESSPSALLSRLDALFERAHTTYPAVHLWVKDENSHYLGACSNLLGASALDRATFFSGIDDVDARLPWMRQGPLYIRDDREVFRSSTAKKDIVERQDRVDGTLWLRTTKVPYRSADGTSGGTVGCSEIISAKEAWTLSRRHDRQTQETPSV